MENRSNRESIEKVVRILSLGDLTAVLDKHNVNWQSWKTEDALNVKSIEDLFKEVESSDCDFVERNGELIRRIRVLGLKVYAFIGEEKYVLVEDRQEFSSGGIRRRQKWSSVSEKIKMNEDVNDKLIARALQEELNLSGGYEVEQIGVEINTQNNNPSFPGIKSEYPIYKFNVFLNSTAFKREGYVEIQDGLTTYFEWHKLDT